MIVCTFGSVFSFLFFFSVSLVRTNFRIKSESGGTKENPSPGYEEVRRIGLWGQEVVD